MDFIVKNGDQIVGKYRSYKEPIVPNDLTIQQVNDVTKHDVEEWDSRLES